MQEHKLKNPDIELLKSYSGGASKEFWSKFPSCDIPNVVQCNVNVAELENLIKSLEHKLTASQKVRAMKTVEYFKNGAPSHVSKNLNSCFVKNGASAIKHGEKVVDTIATWIKKGFACGPFNEPPFKKFRVNPIIAIPQENKVRIVLNVSEPAGSSLNDALDKNSLEKCHMSSARNFGYILKKCGKNAVFSKSDIEAAYKQIPSQLADLWLQGFFFLDKFFVEKSQIFGACSAVCNFDTSGNTVSVLSIAECEGNDELVCRHLDDHSNASPANSDMCSRMTEAYKKICKLINLPLQEDDPELVKAFSNTTKGKVLGIFFDSSDLSWSLPKDKKTVVMQRVHRALNSNLISVHDMQKLLGHLNYVSLLCPLLVGFRRNLFEDLKMSTNTGSQVVRLSEESKNDLKVWTGFLLDKKGSFPIPSQPCEPPLCHKSFTSDAAGRADSDDSNCKVGVASIGLNEDGEICFASRFWWDPLMISCKKDRDGKRFGNKTTFLETVGLMLPLLSIPELLKNQHIVMYVDNIGTVQAWENKYAKEDVYTSILIRTIHLISCVLSSIIHVKHVPRMSTWESVRVDSMSRESTSSSSDNKLLSSFEPKTFPVRFSQWLNNPSVDWSMPMYIVNHVKEKIK